MKMISTKIGIVIIALIIMLSGFCISRAYVYNAKEEVPDSSLILADETFSINYKDGNYFETNYLGNKEKEKLESKYNNLANERAEMDFTRCRDLVEKYVSMKEPSRTLIKRLIDSIVVYDYGDKKEVKINLKFKVLSYLASTTKA